MNATKDESRKFEKYVRICSHFLSGLGISPVKFYHGESGDVCRVSLWRLTISALTMALGILITVNPTLTKEFDVTNLESAIITSLATVAGGLVMSVLIGSVMLTSRSYASLISTMLRFNRCITDIRSRKVGAQSLKLALGYSAAFATSLSLDLFLLYQIEELISLKFFLSYIPGLIEIFSLWHFNICCFWLREYLCVININIEKHSKLFTSLTPLVGGEFLKDNSVFPECSEPQPELNANTLRHIRRLYHEVYIISQKMNSVFATRTLVLVAYNFTLGTTLIYCAVNQIITYNINNANISFLLIFNYTIWVSMCFLVIYGIIWPCNKIYEEMGLTILLIQKLFTKSSEGDFQLELQSFILQLIHEKIIFSPHGFFKVNNHLVLSLIGCVASYLVILIQFRISVV